MPPNRRPRVMKWVPKPTAKPTARPAAKPAPKMVWKPVRQPKPEPKPAPARQRMVWRQTEASRMAAIDRDFATRVLQQELARPQVIEEHKEPERPDVPDDDQLEVLMTEAERSILMPENQALITDKTAIREMAARSQRYAREKVAEWIRTGEWEEVLQQAAQAELRMMQRKEQARAWQTFLEESAARELQRTPYEIREFYDGYNNVRRKRQYYMGHLVRGGGTQLRFNTRFATKQGVVNPPGILLIQMLINLINNTHILPGTQQLTLIFRNPDRGDDDKGMQLDVPISTGIDLWTALHAVATARGVTLVNYPEGEVVIISNGQLLETEKQESGAYEAGVEYILATGFFFIHHLGMILPAGAARVIHSRTNLHFRVAMIPSSGFNNCVIDCLAHATGYPTLSIRRWSKVEEGEPLTIEDTYRLGAKMGIDICIVLDCSVRREIVFNGNFYDVSDDNIDMFMTEAKYIDVLAPGSRPFPSSINLLWVDGHAQLILGRLQYDTCTGWLTTRSGEPTYDNKRAMLRKHGRLTRIGEYRPPMIGLPPRETNLPDQYRYAFFDFETYYDESGTLSALSAACVISDICIGTRLPDDSEYSKPDNQFATLESGCIYSMLKWLEERTVRVKRIYLIGFNNSRFDNFPLLNAVASYNYNGAPITPIVGEANGAILKLDWGRYVVKDLCRFVNMSLFAAGKEFDVDVKKSSFDHHLIQDMYWDYVRKRTTGVRHIEVMPDDDLNVVVGELVRPSADIIVDEFIKSIGESPLGVNYLEYNLRDCVATAMLYTKVEKALVQSTSISIRDCATLPQLAFKAFNMANELKDDAGKVVRPKQEKFPIYHPQSMADWKLFREGMFGGRSQQFGEDRMFDSKSTFVCFDVKSLYGYVMVACPYPVGVPSETATYQEGKVGYYFGIVKNTPGVRCVPKRVDTSSLDWMWPGSAEPIWLYSPCIETLRAHGGEFETLYGYYWEQATTELFGIVRHWMAMKQEQDDIKKSGGQHNAALRAIYKLLTNSLSGKLSQKAFDTECYVARDPVACIKARERLDSSKPITITRVGIEGGELVKGTKLDTSGMTLSPCHLGGLVYSYARSHCYRAVLSKCPNAIRQTETDSFWLDLDHPETRALIETQSPHQLDRFGKFRLGDDPGEFEEELGTLQLVKTTKSRLVIVKSGDVVDNVNNRVWRVGSRRCTRLCFGGRKVYGAFDDSGEPIKMRARGIRFISEKDYAAFKKCRDGFYYDRFLDLDKLGVRQGRHENTHKAAVNAWKCLSLSEQEKFYLESEPILCLKTYMDIAEGKLVIAICSQLVKFWGSNQDTLNMNQVFRLKLMLPSSSADD